MASIRVTDDEVLALVDTQRDACMPFIEVAHNIVEEHLTSKITNAAILKDIELYLAAHFLTITEERGALIRSSLGESAETLADIYEGEGFRSSRFGIQALAMDYTGTLRILSTAKLPARLTIV